MFCFSHQPCSCRVTQNPDPTPQADPLFKGAVANRATGAAAAAAAFSTFSPGLEQTSAPEQCVEIQPHPKSQTTNKMDLDCRMNLDYKMDLETPTDMQSTGVVDSKGERNLTLGHPLNVAPSKLDSNLKSDQGSVDSEKDSKIDLAIFEEEILTPFGRSSDSLNESDSTDDCSSETGPSDTEEYVATCKLETILIEPTPGTTSVRAEPALNDKSLGAISKCLKDEKPENYKTEEEKLIFGILQNKICDKKSEKETKKASLDNQQKAEVIIQQETEEERHDTLESEDQKPKLEELNFIDEDDTDSKLDNPSIQVDPENDDVNQLSPLATAKSPSRSSLGAFFHQKLFHSASAASSAPTSTSSGHSSPETKCVLVPVPEHNPAQTNNTVMASSFSNNACVPASMLDACLTLINFLLFPTSNALY